MKDIVENRRRMKLSSKAKLGLLSLRENGFRYMAYLGLSYLATSTSHFAFGRADSLRKRYNLPGVNSRSANKLIWEDWDWSQGGDEWTPSSDWKQAVVSKFIDPNFRSSDRVLEIGPGAGRWTEYLIPRVASLIGVDISETCVAECRRKFSGKLNVEFQTGSGRDLAGVPDGSIDRIWSFDVFVHINQTEFSAYAREFARVLKSGGLGIIHHGASGGSGGGWRSDVTTEQASSLLQAAGLIVASQITEWEDAGKTFEAGLYSDVITTFRKP